jgi:hypothetical protein
VITGDTGGGLVFRDASLSELLTGVLIVGNNVPFFNSTLRITSMLAAANLGGSTIARPDGRFTFTSPLALTVRGPDQTHLYWIEPDVIPDTLAPLEWLTMRFTSVWMSSASVPGPWAAPQQIFHGPLRWSMTGVDQQNGSAPGSLIAFSSDQDVIVIAPGSEASLHRIPVTMLFPIYPTVGSHEGRMLLAFIAGDPSVPGGDRNSVFVQSSGDGGQSWSRPVAIYRARGLPAYDAKLLRSSDGVWHLVWRTQSGSGAAALHHSSSGDDGSSWSESKSIGLPTGAAGLRVVMDAGDRIHAVYDDWGGGGTDGHIDHVIWNGEWLAPTHLYAPMRPTNPILLAQASGDVVLAFLTHSPGGPVEASTIRSMYARWRC